MNHRAAILGLITLVAAACDGSTGPDVPKATTVAVSAGDAQSTRATQSFAQQLAVKVSDAAGKGVAGVRVTFQVASGTASLNPAEALSDVDGMARTTVSAGSTPGSVVVSARADGVTTSANFNLTITPLAVAITVVSGNTQSIAPAQAFAQPLIVKVSDDAGNGVSGIQVNFESSGAGATLTPTSTTSDAQGLARTTVLAGAVSGNITVTARAANITTPATFTLSINALVIGTWQGTTSESNPIFLRINAARALDSLSVRLTFPTLTGPCTVTINSRITNSTVTGSAFDFVYALNAVTDLRLSGTFEGTGLTGSLRVVAASSGLYACGSNFFGASPSAVLATRTFTATSR